MNRKKIGIGIEDYKEIVDKNYYYIDKTLLIRELLDKGGKVNLFTRPRRFGKTLALSMLRTFFEKMVDAQGNVKDNRSYFEGTKIMGTGTAYAEHMGRYPVINLSLKTAKQPDFTTAYECLKEEIAGEYKRHRYVLDAVGMLESDKEKYRAIMECRAEYNQYATSLKFLSECLNEYHGKKAIILLDEYDVPLENAWFAGFYDQMTGFVRSLFESGLKTNEHLEWAVVTGCLRISKESIFTGLNNLEIISILSVHYAEYFGFTEAEAEEMLRVYDLEEKVETVREWYDGYMFGNTEVYNPWSVINYVKTMLADKNSFPKPYWTNTSSNNVVKELIEKADAGVRQEIEELIAGGTIEKPVHEDITYGDIHKTQDNLWNFLLFTGYLKVVGQRFEVDTIYLTLKIPNMEIWYIYRNFIREWFNMRIKTVDFTPFYRAMIEGDEKTLEETIKGQLKESISFYDSKESFYHGFLVGLFGAWQDYQVVSNRESGNGRPDLMLKPYDEQDVAVVIEIKHTNKFTDMEEQCHKALEQIEEMNYASALLDEGYRKILKYGMCFCKKSCMVRCLALKV